MKVSRQQAAQNRERVIDTAARLFRERGFEGTGVAELMHAAGLTHGGFYGQFSSKEDLIAQACARSLEGSLDRWGRRASLAPAKPLAAIAGSYLTHRHRDHPGEGCLFAALGSDLPRQGLPVRQAVTRGLRASFDLLATLVPGKSRAARRRKAIATYASLIGAMVLARAVDDTAFSDEILHAVSDSVSA